MTWGSKKEETSPRHDEAKQRKVYVVYHTFLALTLRNTHFAVYRFSSGSSPQEEEKKGVAA